MEAEVIGLFVQLSRLFGQPRSYAEIYAVLFMSPQPMTMDELIERLGISKGSASQGLGFLRKAGAIKPVLIPGRRPTHYEAVAELRQLALGFLQGQILPQVQDSQSRLSQIVGMAESLPAEERSRAGRRIAMLQSLGQTGRSVLAAGDEDAPRVNASMSSISTQSTPRADLRASAPKGKLSPAEAEAIGLFVHVSRMLGRPKSSAEVYGVLFVSPRPLAVEDVAGRLATSTQAVRAAFRFLRRAGLLRMVYVPGDRRLHYEAVPELQHMVRRFVRDEVVPQLANAENRMGLLAECVNKLPKEQRARLGGRVAALERWGRLTRELASGFLGLFESKANG